MRLSSLRYDEMSHPQFVNACWVKLVHGLSGVSLNASGPQQYRSPSYISHLFEEDCAPWRFPIQGEITVKTFRRSSVFNADETSIPSCMRLRLIKDTYIYSIRR